MQENSTAELEESKKMLAEFQKSTESSTLQFLATSHSDASVQSAAMEKLALMALGQIAVALQVAVSYTHLTLPTICSV
eukprot:1278181-Rhodomonas_salina.2